jgi:NTE family protein
MDLVANRYYTTANFSRMVRRAFGTRYYSRITYSLVPQEDGSNKIIFEVVENPLTFAKIGLNYNQFSGISAIFNVTSRNFLTPTSRSLVTLNIGQNFRLRAEHLQYFSRRANFAFILGTQFDQFTITTYKMYKEAGLYTQNYFKFDGKFGYSTNRDVTIGVGNRFEWIRYDPSISSSLEFKGQNNFLTTYFFIRSNTLDRPVYARKGTKLEAEGDYVFEQNPHVQHYTSTPATDTSFSSIPYQRVLVSLERYSPLGPRWTFLTNFLAGMNFTSKNNVMNEYSIGGLTSTFHNQITFAGLREGTFYSPNVAELQLGLRYQLLSNIYLTGRGNALVSNFISKSSFFNTPDFLSGYALTFSYNFALGPLELSAMYCDQSRRLLGYINISIPF